MLSIIISIIIAITVWCALFFGASSPWWGLFLAIAGIAVYNLAINFILRKKLELKFNEAQQKMQEIHQRITHKATILQQSGCTDIKKLIELQEKEFKAALPQLVAAYDPIKAYYKWSILTERQVNTMLAQLYFQVREYDQAEKLLEKSLALDPMIIMMKATVQYRKKKFEEAMKICKKGSRRFKGDKVAIIYALWSWILIKNKKNDEAIKVLVEGKEKSDNKVLKTNWEHLVNNRVEKFSNAGFGDIWYALNLELPKIQRQKAPNHLRQKRH